MYTFPPAASSAGVPITWTVPPVSPRSELTAIPAAHDAVPMMLCPQPCPTPGNASYSAIIATRGSPDPLDARNAVGIMQTPRSTANPLPSRKSASSADDFTSSKAISGFAWIRSETSTSSLRLRSISAAARFFRLSASVIKLSLSRSRLPYARTYRYRPTTPNFKLICAPSVRICGPTSNRLPHFPFLLPHLYSPAHGPQAPHPPHPRLPPPAHSFPGYHAAPQRPHCPPLRR